MVNRFHTGKSKEELMKNKAGRGYLVQEVTRESHVERWI